MNLFKKTGHFLILLVVVFLFLFSLYKIVNLTRLRSLPVFGTGCGCDPCCPTPTPEPEPTPTPEPEPTPTSTPEPEPTPTSTPTLTPTPAPGNGNGGNGDGGNGSGSAPVCDREKPGTPVLTSLKRITSDQAKLIWTSADRATYYSLAYGLASGDYQFGVDNAGLVTEFIVGGLDPKALYCFVVRANNECQPGDFSNELCEGRAVGGLVLGASTLAATGSSLSDFVFGLGERQEKIIDWLSLDFLTERLPERIELPGGQIDLAVNPARIREGNWPVAEEKANFLLGSALPGKKGNSVIYAHNKQDLFGPLHQTKIGQTIKVVTAVQAFEYQVEEIEVVASDDLSILARDSGEILTLFTCAGVNDESRLMVRAKLKVG